MPAAEGAAAEASGSPSKCLNCASLQGLPVAKELWGKFEFLWRQALNPERMDRDPASTHTKDWWIQTVGFAQVLTQELTPAAKTAPHKRVCVL